MKRMMMQQHEYTAKVAMHLQQSQRIEYDALTKHIIAAFAVCNRVLAGAMTSLQDSVRGLKRDARLPIQKLEEDMQHMQNQLQDIAQANSALRSQLRDLEAKLNVRQVQQTVHSGGGTPSRSYFSEVDRRTDGSTFSSRAPSPCPSDRAAMLQQQAHHCASRGDYFGMITSAQHLSILNKGLSRETSRQPSRHQSRANSEPGSDTHNASHSMGLQLFEPYHMQA